MCVVRFLFVSIYLCIVVSSISGRMCVSPPFPIILLLIVNTRTNSIAIIIITPELNCHHTTTKSSSSKLCKTKIASQFSVRFFFICTVHSVMYDYFWLGVFPIFVWIKSLWIVCYSCGQWNIIFIMKILSFLWENSRPNPKSTESC